MKYLLDTSVCVELIRRRSVRLASQMAKRPTSNYGLSSLTVAELRYGADRSARPLHQHQTLDKFLIPFSIVDFDSSAAVAYGSIRVQLEKSGTPIGAIDTLIAAHAISRDLTLITRNVKEFKRIQGLKIADWSRG